MCTKLKETSSRYDYPLERREDEGKKVNKNDNNQCEFNSFSTISSYLSLKCNYYNSLRNNMRMIIMIMMTLVIRITNNWSNAYPRHFIIMMMLMVKS